ncbi:unnamed protein product [Nippostrongylus brasiliensis]|uniref:Serine/threonine kinase (inferred by orthology to a S. mansoni protein) n=1 Tax=Nippostrongylus brasiliensis TaxID=27835 RepID=A0A0N4XVQ5_NIPBR|nr:unnamed protein product [Nippostrongylus brasiliensis]
MNAGGAESDYEDHVLFDQVLGRGLASTVRKCIEKSTGEVYAVKIVDVSTEKQSEHEARRLREETISEVEILRQLSDHPSIITIHDFYITPSFLFAVFEMAPKGELFDQLNNTVTVSEKKARRLMRQLLDGVAYMHSRDIVHRDLKLENILCIDDERIVISDFGFATRLRKNETLRELCGTPGYLSPEMLKCQMYEDAPGYSHAVDEWALGVIMYTLQLLMMRMIQEGRYEFRAEQWSTITQEAKDMIRHEAESAMFSVYGHWVNRGFYYSRDMLFANKPRPKYQKTEA